MSVPISPGPSKISPSPSSDLTQQLQTSPFSGQDAPPSAAKIHNLGIVLIGQLILPLFLIGAGYLAGKQFSSFFKNQEVVTYTPLMAKIKNLSTTALGGIGLNLALLCYRQANFALNQNHLLSQFLIEDLLMPSLNRGYNLLANPANMKYLISGENPPSDAV